MTASAFRALRDEKQTQQGPQPERLPPVLIVVAREVALRAGTPYKRPNYKRPYQQSSLTLALIQLYIQVHIINRARWRAL